MRKHVSKWIGKESKYKQEKGEKKQKLNLPKKYCNKKKKKWKPQEIKGEKKRKRFRNKI